MNNKEYKLSIDPRILELLGPSLYTNIYYILAELIANAYDADANNVYIFVNEDEIIVEDDGKGMSYLKGEINKYLNVAYISRNNDEDSLTEKFKRKKMGRKGVGKLAALSVSENVFVKTISNGEKSGFILSHRTNQDNLLTPIPDSEISFKRIANNGTAIVMNNPKFKLHSSLKSIKRNLLKIFPLVNKDFQIHIIKGKEKETISDFDKEMIGELSTLITIGEKFSHLNNYFSTKFESNKNKLLINKEIKRNKIEIQDKYGEVKTYNLEIVGWIGTYLSTRGRKVSVTDFPDNFISLYANNKLGEFNILPLVGQNKLSEVYVVGQLHIDIFELSDLPDMALSNRQGYKSDDLRYQAVIKYVRNELLPEILKMRDIYVSLNNSEKENNKIRELRDKEIKLRNSIEKFKKNTSKNAAKKISLKLGMDDKKMDSIEDILLEEINANTPELGIKNVIDSQKKKILISQTYDDKDLADIIYLMLLFNNVPAADIIYTNSDDEIARIPEGYAVYDYLRDFFVESYSTQKMYVIFVTSNKTKGSWGALIEVGASWITQVDHNIFNIGEFRPEHPLDDERQWHRSCRDDDGSLKMSRLSQDIFCQKIEYICDQLGYNKKSREENKQKLESLVKITER